MIFVFGGAYQGKLDFVKEKFSIREEDVFVADKSMDIDSLPENTRCIYGLHAWVRALVERGEAVDEKVRGLIYKLIVTQKDDVVIIMDDVSQGIVPMDKVERAFREANGRAMIRLARDAKEVYRVFCGIGVKIK